MPRRIPSSSRAHEALSLAGWKLVCLCAAWCRTCEGYTDVMQTMADTWPALECYWMDIEDDADLMGDLDIETFPTVVLADASGQLRFVGVLQPQLGVLQRLLQQATELTPLPVSNYADAMVIVQVLEGV